MEATSPVYVRAAGLVPAVTGTVPWVVLSSSPAIAALVVFPLAEWLVVGKRR